jgi:hypothetical protein
MAEIGTAIYSRLSNYAGLVALVADRVYPQKVPQDCPLPAVRITETMQAATHTLQADSALKRALYQVSVFAQTYAEAKAVAAQVQAALQDYSGTVATVAINRIIFDGSAALYDDSTQTDHIALDFEVWYY